MTTTDNAFTQVSPSRSGRTSTRALDVLRARALRGDNLVEIPESRREWVWRSLLKGTRLKVARDLARLTDDEVQTALLAIRTHYQWRSDEFKRARQYRL